MIDKEKAIKLAKELGLNVSFDQDAGVIMNGKVVSFEELFAEISIIDIAKILSSGAADEEK